MICSKLVTRSSYCSASLFPMKTELPGMNDTRLRMSVVDFEGCCRETGAACKNLITIGFPHLSSTFGVPGSSFPLARLLPAENPIGIDLFSVRSEENIT